MLVGIKQRRVHYDLIGDVQAPVVCLVHALMADGGMWSEQVLPLLNEGFQVLRVDLPGHGGSAAGTEPGKMTEFANDIAALFDEIGLPRVHYCGLSIGGIIGQALAINHPNRLISLFLADTASASPPTAKEMWAQRLKIVQEAGSLAPIADSTMDRVLTTAFKEKNPILWASVRSTILETQISGFVQCAKALEDFNFTDQLPGILVPTFVVCGDGDPATPPAEGKRIASLVPGAQYQEISNSRHYPNIEQPDEFNSVLIRWLNSQLKK